MNFIDWKSNAEQLLSQLRAIDFGYPLGENVVREAVLGTSFADESRLSATSLDELRKFYEVCDGVSWPDVQNGYFLKQRKDIGQTKDQYDPIRVTGTDDYQITVVGSSGTGTLFAINGAGNVLSVPSGKIEQNAYFDTTGKIQVVAESFSKFAEILLVDLKAFVEDKPEHAYVALG